MYSICLSRLVRQICNVQAKSGLHHRSSGLGVGLKLRVIKLIKKLGLITFKTFLWLSKLCLKFFLLFAITLIASNQIICFLIKTFPSFERSLLGQRKKWYCSKFWFVIPLQCYVEGNEVTVSAYGPTENLPCRRAGKE